MRRRIGAPAAPAASTAVAPAPAPAPAPVPVAPVPVAPVAPAPAPAPAPVAPVPVVQAEIIRMPAPSALPMMFSPELFLIGRFVRDAALLPAGGGGSPYLGFFSSKAANAGDVLRALGNATDGAPYLSVGGDIYSAAGWDFLVLQELPHWVTLDNATFAPDRCWLTPRPFGATVGKPPVKVQEQILCVLMLVPGAQPIPADLGPVVATCSTIRATKAKAIKTHLDEVERSLTAEWAREGANGPLAAAVPERFRICSSLAIEAKTAKSGFAYSQVDSVPRTASLAQLSALAAWQQDAEAQEDLRGVLDAFNRRADELRELAAETLAAEQDSTARGGPARR